MKVSSLTPSRKDTLIKTRRADPSTETVQASGPQDQEGLWPALVVSLIAGSLGFLVHLQLPTIGPRGTMAVRALLVIAMLANGALVVKMVRTRFSVWVGLTSILTSGLALRLHMLALVRQTMLFPDAQTYQTQAAQEGLGTFWNGTNWTPFWVYLVRLWGRIFGPSAFAQRTLSLVLSLAVITATYWLGKRVHSTAGGLIAAALVSLSPFLAFSAVQGLREETGILLVLILLILLVDRKPSLWIAASAGIVLGLIGLTRSEYVPAVLLVALAVWVWRKKWLWIAAALTIAGLLLVPQAMLIKAYFGDTAYFAKLFTRGWVNIEYQTGNLTEEQFARSSDGSKPLPTKEELQKNLFAGPLLTPMEWYFEVHDPQQTAVRTVKGTATLPFFAVRSAIWSGHVGSFLTDHAKRDQEPYVTATWVLGLLALVGLGVLSIKGHWGILLFVLAISGIYAVPFTIGGVHYSRDPSVFDMRLSEVLIPLMAVGLGSLGAIATIGKRGRSPVLTEPVSSKSTESQGADIDIQHKGAV